MQPIGLHGGSALPRPRQKVEPNAQLARRLLVCAHPSSDVVQTTRRHGRLAVQGHDTVGSSMKSVADDEAAVTLGGMRQRQANQAGSYTVASGNAPQRQCREA